MPTIPKLNLDKGLTPEQVASILNRWADHVTTALNEVDNHTKSTNQLTLAQRDFITKVPLVTVDSGSGNMQKQPVVSSSPRKPPLPGPPKFVGQDNLNDGDGVGGGRFRRVDHITSGNRVSIGSLLGDTSGDTATDLIDTGNKRFLHPMMSTGTQAVATSGGSIQNTAPVVGHPSANIGTALQKLNSGGLLLDVDQIAAQGTTHKVVSAIDTNERALIDLTQTGHIGSLANHYEMVVAASPVSYWKLDEKSGTSAIDSTTNARTGTYHGGFALSQASAIAGEIGTVVGGGSVELNGTTGYMQVPFSSALNPSVFSVAFWVFPESNPASEFALAQSGTSTTGWQFNQQPTGNIYAILNGTISVPGAVASLGAWSHYVLTYNGTAAHLYHNGVLVGSATVTFSANTTKDIFLGTDSTVGVGFFHGRFDEFAIFNTALSAQQIAGLYQAGSVGPHRTVDDVPDGSTYVRIGNVNPDHTFHLSTPFVSQSSMLPIIVPSGALSYSATGTAGATNVFTCTWGAFTIAFPDGSTINVPASTSLPVPAAPTLSQVAGGTLVQGQHFVAVGLVKDGAIYGISNTSSITLSNNFLLKVTSPAAVSGYDGWVPLVSFGNVDSNICVQQTPGTTPIVPIAFGTDWTEPTSGFLTTGELSTSSGVTSPQGMKVAGLSQATTYHFYPAYDKTLNQVVIPNGARSSPDVNSAAAIWSDGTVALIDTGNVSLATGNGSTVSGTFAGRLVV